MSASGGRSSSVERFDAIYAQHARALYAFLFSRTHDADLARDLVQETCIRLWRAIDEVGSLSIQRRQSWLFSVARNLVVDEFRSRSSALAREHAFGAEHETTAPPADAHIARDESLHEMDQAIGRLPEALREVLVLSVLGERNSSEIAEILGRPAGTVRYQLAHARRLLAVELGLQ